MVRFAVVRRSCMHAWFLYIHRVSSAPCRNEERSTSTGPRQKSIHFVVHRHCSEQCSCFVSDALGSISEAPIDPNVEDLWQSALVSLEFPLQECVGKDGQTLEHGQYLTDDHVRLALYDVRRRCSEYASVTSHTAFIDPQEAFDMSYHVGGIGEEWAARLNCNHILMIVAIISNRGVETTAIQGERCYAPVVVVRNCDGVLQLWTSLRRR